MQEHDILALERVVDTFKLMHSPLSHTYAQHPECCPRCRLVKETEEALEAVKTAYNDSIGVPRPAPGRMIVVAVLNEVLEQYDESLSEDTFDELVHRLSR